MYVVISIHIIIIIDTPRLSKLYYRLGLPRALKHRLDTRRRPTASLTATAHIYSTWHRPGLLEMIAFISEQIYHIVVFSNPFLSYWPACHATTGKKTYSWGHISGGNRQEPATIILGSSSGGWKKGMATAKWSVWWAIIVNATPIFSRN